MFENVVVVQSAVSAFNNAALVAPAFLWWAILALPLFAFVYFCGNMFLERIGWKTNNLLKPFALTAVGFTLVWIILFGGNYDVLRDNITLLPFVVAAITFMSAFFMGAYTKDIKVAPWRELSRGNKIKRTSFVLLVLLFVGLSDLHTWWGPILQIGALAAGGMFGRKSKYQPSLVPGMLIVMLATTIAILMQPEYFRFGQLGSLTPLHLLFLLFIGVFAVATMALRNVSPKKRIRKSAYVKLKWLARLMTVLCIALFLFTESVPVFLGTLVMVGVLFAMSIWHAEDVSPHVSDKTLALVLMAFGTVTVMPVITSLGILYWINTPQVDFWKQIKFLL